MARNSSRAPSPSNHKGSFSRSSSTNGYSSRRSSRVFTGSDMPERRSLSRGAVGQRRNSIFSRSSKNASVEDFTLKRRSTTLNSVTGTSKASEIKYWDGNRRTTSTWDCLKRDPDLWYPSGDCLIHFYERGQSKRGASLRVLLADIEESNCRPLLEKTCASPVPESPNSSGESSSDDGGFFSNPSSAGKYELHIPAPPHLNREEALQFHLTTRNFFAWMFEKPLVGHKLGDALIMLLERMNQYRPDPEENQDDLLAYIDLMGYTDFRGCPDHALAVLQFAEKFQDRELWTDAFVHCAGMNNELVTSGEFMSISRTTKALITRAHLEMDVRLDRAGRALGDFLEEEFSSGYLGLTSAGYKHLERFRSFLHSFYVQQDGYWPPTNPYRRGNTLPKPILRAMYFDFRSLYEYLVDMTFSAEMIEICPPTGDTCGLEAITAFDKRNRYTTLPNPFPKLPALSAFSMHQKPKGLSKLFGNKHVMMERRMDSFQALAAATNSNEFKIMESPLVREYYRFEREYTLREDDNISSADARKIRWLLIYSILQTLISVTRAPQEVRDTEGVDYPLCCQTAGTPPWTFIKPQVEELKPPMPIRAAELSTGSPSHEIFSQPTPARPVAIRTQSTPNLRVPVPSNIRPKTATSPTAPIPVRHPQPRKPVADILINGYGNGTNIHKSTITMPGSFDSESTPSDPTTPSSAMSRSTAPSSRWSERESSEYDTAMEPSIRDTPSIYDDGSSEMGRQNDLTEEIRYGLGMPGLKGVDGVVSNEWKKLGMGLLRGLEMEREKIRKGELEEAGRWGTSSVESWAPRRVNPEVDMYILSG